MKRDIVLRTYSDCKNTGNLGIYDIPRKSDKKVFSFYYDKRNTTTLNCLKDVVNGEYKELSTWIMEHNTDVLLDAGSHMGSLGISCAEDTGLIICIEPNYVNYSFLTENLRLNNVHNTISIPGAIVHGYERRTKLQFHMTNSTDSTIHAKRLYSYPTEVTAYNFYDIIQTFHVNVVKMDIEGEEIPIILSADSDLLNSLDFMILEYHEHLLSENFNKRKKVFYMDKVVEKLEKVFHVTVRGSGVYRKFICKNRKFQ